jgi:uncharacterized protein (DUF2147 family)
MTFPKKGEAVMKVAIAGLFAAGLALTTGPTNAASLVDTVIGSARAQWNLHECQFSHGSVSCKKSGTSAKEAYKTSSAKSTPLNDSSVANTPRSANPVGQWIVDDGDRRVQIMQCGKWLCGVISAAKPDAVDCFNPDPDRRNRTIVNLPVLIEMMQTENNHWEGHIYNVKDGRTYFGKISLRSGNVLEVEGTAPHALLLQSWIKDTDDLR